MKTFNTLQLLRQKLDEANNLLGRYEFRHSHWKDWSSTAKALLTLTLGRDDPHRRIFKQQAEAIDRIKESHAPDEEQSRQRKELLPALIQILEELWTRELGSRVFIVHGRDEASLQMVARLVEKLELTPIVLREQEGMGRTIIEQFEHHSDVSSAVVLLTGDDVGKLAASKDELRPRARQNVILELGFFAGRLGRSQVCVLHREGVEIPSDYSGVIFIKMDEGDHWKYALARTLLQIGFRIDLTKVH